MTGMHKALGMASAMLIAITGLLVTAGRAHADDPVMHHVKYTITAQNPIYTDIYYLDHEPARFSDYSHNPYSFTPHIDVDLGPGKGVELRAGPVEPRRLRDGRGEHGHGARHAGASL